MGFLKSIFGGSSHVVTAEPSGLRFEVKSSQSVLEAALAQGIAFPHSCTVGTCGACKCRLKSGKIREISNFGYVLNAEELRGGVILACQAAARTDLVLDVPGLADKRLVPPRDFVGRITGTRALTHDILEVTLSLDAPMQFDAGQYVQLQVEGVWGARAYSIASPPQAAGSSEFRFMIRLVPNGAFTEPLFKGTLTGKPAKVHGPCGNFWLRESRGPLLAVAGGSGLAPLLSMLADAASRETGRSCLVLFGARTAGDLYAQREIAAIGKRWNGAFEFVPVLSQEPADSDWDGARGLVTEVLALRAAELAGADAEAYLCGPPPMIDAALPVLEAAGFSSTSIHADRFLDGSHGLQRQG